MPPLQIREPASRRRSSSRVSCCKDSRSCRSIAIGRETVLDGGSSTGKLLVMIEDVVEAARGGVRIAGPAIGDGQPLTGRGKGRVAQTDQLFAGTLDNIGKSLRYGPPL